MVVLQSRVQNFILVEIYGSQDLRVELMHTLGQIVKQYKSDVQNMVVKFICVCEKMYRIISNQNFRVNQYIERS